VPTYFIGAYGRGSSTALAALAAAPDCGIRHLGRAGTAGVAGLLVSFLDGTHNFTAFRAAPEDTSGSDGSCRYYTAADVEALKRRLQVAEGDIDLLLTNEWPAGAAAGLPEPSRPPTGSPRGADPPADAALAARPRYHFAGGGRSFYQRPPYVNVDLGAGAHATRLIALADVGNTSKEKWLHALALTPAADMAPEALQALPQGATPCPYVDPSTGLKRTAPGADGGVDEAGLGEQTWRWEDRGARKRQRGAVAAPSLGRKDVERDASCTAFVRNVSLYASEEDIVSFFLQAGRVIDVVRRANAEGRLNPFCHVQFDSAEAVDRACQLNGSDLCGRSVTVEQAAPLPDRGPKGGPKGGAPPGKPVDGCWFCLSNPNADVELVVSVGEECYVAIDKGAITDDHVLVVPVEHFASSQALPHAAHAELERYLSALRSCWAGKGKELVGFERHMALRKSGGNHCHINAIAVPAAAAKDAREAFERAAKRRGIEGLTHLGPSTGEAARDALRAVLGGGEGAEYFVALLPDGSRLVHPIPYGERFPLDFGREVLAELAGAPQRADWKACKVGPEEERARVERFKAAFESYDIMQG
jgi:diadenosine tetraphosphate (Ap4A) HIT family hydrolase